MIFKRRPLQRIQIGDAIVTVTETSRGYCLIGVDAPRELPVKALTAAPESSIRRSSIREEIRQEKGRP